ncbi:MAG: hypothetical protein CHACPFDD_00467 [Phycisphaerae bacterium]|nr:hypothetical protein [Phycisphaerae bacterium]
MSIIRPFRAIRFAGPAGQDISSRIAPPYDVLEQSDKDRLLRADPRNFVAVDLPHVPPKAAGPPAAYDAARKLLASWLQSSTMTVDTAPALYAYYQRYTHAGRTYDRKMFFAALRLTPFGDGDVYPHEQTFGGPKEDRLCLMRATAAQLSPIFGLYEDDRNEIAARLGSSLAPTPAAIGTMDGVENRIWAVSDVATVRDVSEMMRSRPIYIADGHHRYGTAMMYRDELRMTRDVPDSHPANYVLCACCAMGDPGLQILPTHRVLDVAVPPTELARDPELKVTALPISRAADVATALAALGPQAMALYDGASRGYHVVTPRNPDILAKLSPEKGDAWRKLALAFLHVYLLDRVVQPRFNGGSPPHIEYIKSAEDAVAQAQRERSAAFLMQATTMAELRAVCKAGDLMPQKSTFFFPKLASGLVVHSLDGKAE